MHLKLWTREIRWKAWTSFNIEERRVYPDLTHGVLLGFHRWGYFDFRRDSTIWHWDLSKIVLVRMWNRFHELNAFRIYIFETWTSIPNADKICSDLECVYNDSWSSLSSSSYSVYTTNRCLTKSNRTCLRNSSFPRFSTGNFYCM